MAKSKMYSPQLKKINEMFLFCLLKTFFLKYNETTAVRLSMGIYDEIDETTILNIKKRWWHFHSDQVWQRYSCDDGKEICQIVCLTFGIFALLSFIFSVRLYLLLKFASYAMVFRENAVKIIYFCFGSLQNCPFGFASASLLLDILVGVCRTALWDYEFWPILLHNFLIANERSDSDAITVPWTNSAQNTPSLSFNLWNGRQFLTHPWRPVEAAFSCYELTQTANLGACS